MANQKARTKGTGKAGSHSSRHMKRAPAKDAAASARRAEDKVEAKVEEAFPAPKPDAEVTNHGSIYCVRPVTDAAKQWLEENVGLESQWLGPSLAVEHRYIEDLIEGMKADGLVVV